MLIDSLNESELAKLLSDDPKPGIARLESAIKEKVADSRFDKSITFLKNLQSLRLRGAAHREGSEYQKTLKKSSEETADLRSVYDQILKSSVEFLRDMCALVPYLA